MNVREEEQPIASADVVNQTEEKPNESILQEQLRRDPRNGQAGVDNSKNTGISVYPNPVDQKFTLSLVAEQGDNVRVVVYDVTGRAVYQKEFDNLSKGTNNLTIEPSKGSFFPGYHTVRVIFINNAEEKSIKIIKR